MCSNAMCGSSMISVMEEMHETTARLFDELAKRSDTEHTTSTVAGG